MIADLSRGEWLDTLLLVDAEKARDPIDSLPILKRELAARAQNCPDKIEGLTPFFRLRRQHRRNGLESGLGIDQQDIELLAH